MIEEALVGFSGRDKLIIGRYLGIGIYIGIIILLGGKLKVEFGNFLWWNLFTFVFNLRKTLKNEMMQNHFWKMKFIEIVHLLNFNFSAIQIKTIKEKKDT